jgi:hypothetical protein
MEAPYRGSDWFRVEDMNFDGYDDVFVLTTWGATGNEAGCVWLYDPQSGRFEFSKEFTNFGAFEGMRRQRPCPRVATAEWELSVPQNMLLRVIAQCP